MYFYSKGHESQAKGDYQTALKYYVQCLKQNQLDINCINAIGSVYKETKDYEKANEFYKQCLQLNPKEMYCLVNYSQSLAFMSENNQALEFANQCVKYHPNEPVCYETKGLVYQFMKKYTESAEQYNKCLQLKNDDFGCASNLAITSYNCDKIDESEKAALKCLEIGGRKKGVETTRTGHSHDSLGLSTSNYLLGLIYNQKNDPKKAQQYFQQCLKINPNHEDCERKLSRNLFFDKGLQSQAEEKQQEAEQYFQECLKEDKNNTNCIKALGNIYNKKQNYEKANYYFEQCLKIKPKEMSCLSNLSESLASDKQYEKAMEYADKCIKYHPQQSLCYRRKGEVYQEQNNYFLAKEQYIKSYQLDNNIENAFNLAQMSFHTEFGKKEEAEKIALECVKIGKSSSSGLKIPFTSQCYYLLGQIYLERFEHNKSQQYFKECVKLNPNNQQCKKFIFYFF